jgi:rod shape-determining protein MreD
MGPLGELALIGAASFIQQIVLSEFLPSIHRYVDLYLIIVVYISVRRSQGHALLMGAGAGLLQDVFNHVLLGVNSFSKCLLAFVISGLGSRFMLNQPLPQFGALVLGTLAEFGIAWALLSMLGQKVPEPVILLQRSLANGVAGLVLFLLLNRLGPPQSRTVSAY